MRRCLALPLWILAALVLGATLASSAPAGSGGSKDPAGDAKVQGLGLSKAQQDALDLVAVRVTGARGLGVFVTATFKGNIERELGRGKLAKAVASMVLRPKNRKLSSSGLVTTGPGKLGKLYRHTKSTNVGAFRHGRTLKFFLLGPGYELVKSVVVETVANPGRLVSSSAVADDTPYIGQRIWDKFITLHPIDLHVQVGDPSALTCPELRNLLDSIDADLDDPYFSQNVSFSVVRALHKFRGKVKGLVDKCERPPPPTVAAVFKWSRFSPKEVAGVGRFTGPAHTFNSVRIVLPEEYSISNHLCPAQLPNSVISGNSITCAGGALATNQAFKLNLQTVPVPPVDMGGQLFGVAGGTSYGPFTITGP